VEHYLREEVNMSLKSVRQVGGGGEERGRNGWENEERERGKKWSREKG